MMPREQLQMRYEQLKKAKELMLRSAAAAHEKVRAALILISLRRCIDRIDFCSETTGAAEHQSIEFGGGSQQSQRRRGGGDGTEGREESGTSAQRGRQRPTHGRWGIQHQPYIPVLILKGCFLSRLRVC